MSSSPCEARRPFARRAWRALPAVVVLLAGGAACGNLTMGGFGEAVVVVSGDAPDSISAPAIVQPALVPTTLRQPASAQAAIVEAALAGPASTVADPARTDHEDDEEDRPEGQLEAEMRLFLVSDGGAAVELSDDVVEVQVDLEGVEQDETLPKDIPADVYTILRIVFLEIEVEVDAGLVINGDTITGPIDIEIESDSLVVERPVALRIDDGQRTEILIDLNAASWLQAVDPVTLTVSADAFADLITIEVR